MTRMGRLAIAISCAIVAASVLVLRPMTTGRCFSFHPQPGVPLPPGTYYLPPNGPLCPIPQGPSPFRWWLASIVLGLGVVVLAFARPRREKVAAT